MAALRAGSFLPDLTVPPIPWLTLMTEAPGAIIVLGLVKWTAIRAAVPSDVGHALDEMVTAGHIRVSVLLLLSDDVYVFGTPPIAVACHPEWWTASGLWWLSPALAASHGRVVT